MKFYGSTISKTDILLIALQETGYIPNWFSPNFGRSINHKNNPPEFNCPVCETIHKTKMCANTLSLTKHILKAHADARFVDFTNKQYQTMRGGRDYNTEQEFEKAVKEAFEQYYNNSINGG